MGLWPRPGSSRIWHAWTNCAAAVEVLTCDEETAQWYATVKFKLRKKGRPIPENDVWIAAIASQHKLTLLSRDSHFHGIEGLGTEVVRT